MDNKIRMAFEQIHVDRSLKEKTKESVYRRTHGFEKTNNTRARRVPAVAVCVLTLVLIIGGYFSYSIPVAAVSIDVNPSIELQINLYDRVINVKGYNDDGDAMVDQLSVKNMDYADAINNILTNEKIKSCVSKDGLLEITVASKEEKRAETMRSCISDQTGIAMKTIYCLKDQDEVAEAHSAGISFGKYRAYLELHKINPDITTDDIRDLTMREIRDMIEKEISDTPKNGKQPSGHGNGNGNGRGRGYGKQSE